MLDPVGFWSYARQDDAHSDGQLSQLRAIVGKQIGLQFGAEVTLWQDIAAIPYGADWAETIERTIGQTTFFIPIVTPRFLKSRYCREEFLSFRRRMQALGRSDLIFPVHYVDVADVRPEEALFGDDLAALKRSQWIDFRPLFYADPKSPEVRRWAGELAGDILKALRRPTAAQGAPEREAPRDSAGEKLEKPPPAASPPAADRATPSAAATSREEAMASPAAPTHLQAPRAGPATGGPSRKTFVIAGVAALVIVAASLGVIALRGPSNLATAPRQATTFLASASPSPTPAAAPIPTPTALASPTGPVVCFGLPLAPLASRTPGVLSFGEACALKPKDVFRECTDCPAMVVVPAGKFTMGSPATERGRDDDEGPQHEVTIAKPFAVAKFDGTFAEWDACVAVGGCPQASDGGFGRGTRPAINVDWDEARQYVAWLSKMTGEPYRLLSEAEWEYTARAGTTTAYYWGDVIGKGKANCKDCGSQWDAKGTSPVGSFEPNGFGLYDMAGNVWQWVEDCYHYYYNGAPSDGSAWTLGDCSGPVVRGGSWFDGPQVLRSADRDSLTADGRGYYVGFRVGRTLTPRVLTP